MAGPTAITASTSIPACKPQRPDLVAKAIAPDYALGAHTASLGLTFNTGNLFPEAMAGGAFVGQHGSWNRKPRAGYKVIFVPFAGGMPSGKPQDVLTGFLNDNGEAQGRPVGVRIDKQGALLVADDVGNAVWRCDAVGEVGVAMKRQPHTPLVMSRTVGDVAPRDIAERQGRPQRDAGSRVVATHDARDVVSRGIKTPDRASVRTQHS